MNVIWRQSPNYSLNQGAKTVIVIHWWGDPAQRPSLSGTVSWLCNPEARVSAHYVVSGTTVYQLVNENHVAWHALQANPYSIGIEVDPNTPPGTYETVSQLCREIAARHNMVLPNCIKGHRDYVNTQCPGNLDLARIRQGATTQGGEEVTKLESFQRVVLALAHRWPTQAETDAWQKSGMEDYTWAQRNIASPVVNDRLALEIYQAARDKAGSVYPGGPQKFASDRLAGGANFAKVMDADMAYYIGRAKLAEDLLTKPATPAPTAEDTINQEVGRKFRELLQEAA